MEQETMVFENEEQLMYSLNGAFNMCAALNRMIDDGTIKQMGDLRKALLVNMKDIHKEMSILNINKEVITQ